MKNKRSFLALMLSALLVLSGCASAAAADAPAATATPAAAAAPAAAQTPEATPAPETQIITEIAAEKETFYDEDGETVLLEFSAALPTVTIPGNEAAAEKINAALKADYDLFVNGNPDWEGISGKEGYLDSAREDLAMRRADGYADYFYGYSLERTVSVSRCDERVISFIVSDYSYTGGAHGGAAVGGMNFDAATGELLELEKLALEPETIPTVWTDRLWEITRDADHAAWVDGYFPDYEKTLPELLRDGNWFFGPEGMTVMANQYAIAPYAAGVIELTLPWAWLAWNIDENYLPPETAADGTLSGEIADDPGECLYIVDDRTDGQGACVTLTARGTVRDLRVSYVDYAEYNNTFWETAQLLYVSRLDDGQRLCVRTWIPDVLPTLKLVYTDESGERSFLISQSGKDGSLVLMDEQPYTALPAQIGGRLPFVYDVDGDGQRETIDVVPDPKEEGKLTITADGAALGDVFSVGDSWTLWLTDLDFDGKAELLFSGDQGSDDYVTYAWHADSLRPIAFTGETRRAANPSDLSQTADGRAVPFGGSLYLESWCYQLGTYRAVRPYELQNGTLAPTADSLWTYDGNTFDLIVKRALPVTLDEGGQTFLEPGTALRLLGTTGNTVRFSAGDVTGTITLEYLRGENSGWTIAGLSENEYFEMLPYAG